MNSWCICCFHAYINEMHGSRSKILSKKSRPYIHISRLRVKEVPVSPPPMKCELPAMGQAHVTSANNAKASGGSSSSSKQISGNDMKTMQNLNKPCVIHYTVPHVG